MKKRIINLTIGLTGLIVSFLPQKADQPTRILRLRLFGAVSLALTVHRAP
jgi:hypothetical protein